MALRGFTRICLPRPYGGKPKFLTFLSPKTDSKSFFIFSVSVSCEFHVSSVICEKQAKHRRNGYYEVLGIPQTSKMADIKHAYLRIAKKHHPDKAGNDEKSKKIFEEATEAYQTLMDPNQRYFYDRHGFPEMELKQGLPTIFDWKPR